MALKNGFISVINERDDYMSETATKEKKTFTEQLAEEINKVPENQKEVVAAHLIGTVHGVLIAADMQRATA